jgi:hypothetical protein
MVNCVKIDENTNTIVNSIDCEGLRWCKTYHKGLWIELGDEDKHIGIGDIYYPEHERFSKPRVAPSWSLNQDTFMWEPPVPKPVDYDGNKYTWSESERNWVPK